MRANSTWRGDRWGQNVEGILFCLIPSLPPSPAQPPALYEEDTQLAGTAPAVASALSPGSFLLLTEALYLHGQITGVRAWEPCLP